MGHRNRLAVLDGLRLCAALGVVAYHSTGVGWVLSCSS
jgi:peptidoglycan/LPS O-acetylase OafA/YrhL